MEWTASGNAHTIFVWHDTAQSLLSMSTTTLEYYATLWYVCVCIVCLCPHCLLSRAHRSLSPFFFSQPPTTPESMLHFPFILTYSTDMLFCISVFSVWVLSLCVGGKYRFRGWASVTGDGDCRLNCICLQYCTILYACYIYECVCDVHEREHRNMGMLGWQKRRAVAFVFEWCKCMCCDSSVRLRTQCRNKCRIYIYNMCVWVCVLVTCKTNYVTWTV